MYIFGSGEENNSVEKNETIRTWLDLRLLRHTHTNTHKMVFTHTHTIDVLLFESESMEKYVYILFSI